MSRRRAGSFFSLAGLMCLAAAGCGGGGKDSVVDVRGRVTNAGEPLKVGGREAGLGVVRVEFYRIGEDGTQSTEPETAAADDNGNFDVPDGVRPGKYRIAVRQWDPHPLVDKLGGRFDEKSSPIIREVTGKEDVIIDLSKPEG